MVLDLLLEHFFIILKFLCTISPTGAKQCWHTADQAYGWSGGDKDYRQNCGRLRRRWKDLGVIGCEDGWMILAQDCVPVAGLIIIDSRVDLLGSAGNQC
jgi:hypothetical protein